MSRVVLDASVAVKWFRSEPGSDDARELLRRHGSGDVVITVPSLFVYEFAGVAFRLLDPGERDELWRRHSRSPLALRWSRRTVGRMPCGPG